MSRPFRHTPHQLMATIPEIKLIIDCLVVMAADAAEDDNAALTRVIRRFEGVLGGMRVLESKQRANASPARQYVCSSCVSARVRIPGGICIDCSGDDGGDRTA